MIDLESVNNLHYILFGEGLDSSLSLILERIERLEKKMSAITDFAAKVETNFAALKSAIQALDDKITASQTSPGPLSATDQAALDGIVADSAALVTQAAATPAVPAP